MPCLQTWHACSADQPSLTIFPLFLENCVCVVWWRLTVEHETLWLCTRYLWWSFHGFAWNQKPVTKSPCAILGLVTGVWSQPKPWKLHQRHLVHKCRFCWQQRWLVGSCSVLAQSTEERARRGGGVSLNPKYLIAWAAVIASLSATVLGSCCQQKRYCC